MNQFSCVADMLFGKYTRLIDEEIFQYLQRQSPYGMYDMMRYFLGYTDENGNPLSKRVGKRFRPGLMCYVADAYGCADNILPAAVSVEFFHNFTLIHDDIEDRDEMRRGRPTVWKIWGVNHAINTGDAQVLLALGPLLGDFPHAKEAASFFLSAFRQVIEGQYLDLSLAHMSLSDERITEEYYREMITKKTAVLIAAAVAGTAIVAGRSDKERDALWQYGLFLGTSYQLADDMQSLYGTEEETGKKGQGDIAERKKTLPIIRLLRSLESPMRERLIALYNSPLLSEAEIEEVVDMVRAMPSIRASLENDIQRYKNEAIVCAEKLQLLADTKQGLQEIVNSV